MLNKNNVEVKTFNNGQDAVSFLRENKDVHFDFALLDWKMPNNNPQDLIKNLRHEFKDTTKIIIITAYNIEDIIAEAKKDGADGFITKPIYTSKLLTYLSEYYTSSEVIHQNNDKPTFNLNVLVAEDNEMNWKVMQKILLKYNVKPVHAENGQEVLDLLQKEKTPFDVILMDIEMPIMNGYDATINIRKLEDKNLSSIPIYAMSANTFAEDIAKCHDIGMDGHLAKPIDISKVLKVLKDIQNKKNNKK